jgi:UDP-2-acetamido-3-amino-2,3-dideoxy-glucuronate N-acetyltransferase
MNPFNSIDPTVCLGRDTKVWHYSVILRHTRIGDNCNIGSHVEIGAYCTIGNLTRIGKGTFIPSRAVIGTNVFIGPNVTFCDDKYPRANNPNYHAEPPVVEDGVSVGAGAVILPGIRLGTNCLVGAGAIVTEDVEPSEVVYGNPARSHLSSFSAQDDVLEQSPN